MKEGHRPWAVAAAALAADRITKHLTAGLPPEGTVLIPGVIRLRPVQNRGIAFSFLSGRPELLGVLSLVIITGTFWYLRNKRLSLLTGIGLMLMLGGAAGNMLDRFFTGYVPDMIELMFVHFAVFNIADACLTVGCALVMIRLIWPEERKKADG